MRDPDEIARRERVWEQAIDAIEYETGRQVAGIPAARVPPAAGREDRARVLQGALSAAGARRGRGVSSDLPPAVRVAPAEGSPACQTTTGFLNRLRERGEEVLTQVSAELSQNPRFMQAVAGAMRGKEKLEEAVGRVLRQMNVPTRSELKRAVARIEALEKRARGAQARSSPRPRSSRPRRLASRRRKAAG